MSKALHEIYGRKTMATRGRLSLHACPARSSPRMKPLRAISAAAHCRSRSAICCEMVTYRCAEVVDPWSVGPLHVIPLGGFISREVAESMFVQCSYDVCFDRTLNYRHRLTVQFPVGGCALLCRPMGQKEREPGKAQRLLHWPCLSNNIRTD